jgi:hypothetical protein
MLSAMLGIVMVLSSCSKLEKARTRTVTVPPGTTLIASLETPLRSDANRTGDPFAATVTHPVRVGEEIVIPQGARVQGTLAHVQPSGRIKGRAAMSLAFQEITFPNGDRRSIAARPLSLVAESRAQQDAETIVAGGVIGAVLGGIARGGKGAAVGGAVGAGTGTAIVLATKGDEIELAPGRELAVELEAPVDVALAQ